jgi:hypothetical protein
VQLGGTHPSSAAFRMECPNGSHSLY